MATMHFVIPGDVVDFNTTTFWWPVREEVVLALSIDLPCAEEYLPKLALALARANGHDDTKGKFFYKEEHGLLVWEHTLFLAGVPGITADQTAVLLDTGWSEFEFHLAALAAAAQFELPSPRRQPEPLQSMYQSSVPSRRPN